MDLSEQGAQTRRATKRDLSMRKFAFYKCDALCQQDGSWAENLSSYFNMNTFLDIILSCVLQKGGNRRIVFSCFDPDICIM